METPESYLNGKNGNLEEWGKGILQNRKDYLTLMALDEAAGLKELVTRLGVVSPPAVSDSENGLPNRFSIHADFNYGTGSIPMTCKYLDSGVLANLIDTNMAKLDENKDEATYTLVILGASAMTIGCALPDSFKAFLQKSSSIVKMSTASRCQLTRALSNYADGTAYNFGNITLLEWMSGGSKPGARIESWSAGWQKYVGVNNPGGTLSICGPPNAEDMGEKETYNYDLCGHCGAETANHGKEDQELIVCDKCKKRKYCSKQCQKHHWKKHRMVCKMVTEQFEKEMKNVYNDAVKQELSGFVKKIRGKENTKR